jgi:hypothetical protein
MQVIKLVMLEAHEDGCFKSKVSPVQTSKFVGRDGAATLPRLPPTIAPRCARWHAAAQLLSRRAAKLQTSINTRYRTPAQWLHIIQSADSIFTAPLIHQSLILHRLDQPSLIAKSAPICIRLLTYERVAVAGRCRPAGRSSYTLPVVAVQHFEED